MWLPKHSSRLSWCTVKRTVTIEYCIKQNHKQTNISWKYLKTRKSNWRNYSFHTSPIQQIIYFLFCSYALKNISAFFSRLQLPKIILIISSSLHRIHFVTDYCSNYTIDPNLLFICRQIANNLRWIIDNKFKFSCSFIDSISIFKRKYFQK